MGPYTTKLLISNLHCQTCCLAVSDILSRLQPYPIDIITEIARRTVSIVHDQSLATSEIVQALLDAGFLVDTVNTSTADGSSVIDIHDALGGLQTTTDPGNCWDGLAGQLTEALLAAKANTNKRLHLEVCASCRSGPSIEGSPQDQGPLQKAQATVNDSEDAPDDHFQNGNSIADSVRSMPPSPSAAIPSSSQQDHTNEQLQIGNSFKPKESLHRAIISIEGMTCAACSGRLYTALGSLPWVRDVNISLLTHSGNVEFDATNFDSPAEGAAKLVEEVEDCGYEASITSLSNPKSTELLREGQLPTDRKLSLEIKGMYCENCPARIISALKHSFPPPILEVMDAPSLVSPILRISYTPKSPSFTLRDIIRTVGEVDTQFTVHIHHPPTLEQRSLSIQKRERFRLAIRFALCCAIAVPTFLIGIVWMSLVPKDNSVRRYFETLVLSGSVPRAQWALFFLSTPVFFLVADVFHSSALKELKVLWRRGSQVPVLQRFYRFGSMNLLVSLGVSVSYFSSLGLLISYATKRSSGDSTSQLSTYFDSTVFLTLFLLLGRLLESYSKSQTGSAVGLLRKLRPQEATLLTSENYCATPPLKLEDYGDKTISEETSSDNQGPLLSHRLDAELLERGDFVMVPAGSSPPADGEIVRGTTRFDESSLTGEGQLVHRSTGDSVYAGTINAGATIAIKITGVGGELLLDQIVVMVQEGQSRRAPIENIANVILGLFVPIVTWIAVIVFMLWLSLGLSGSLPEDYLDISFTDGGWYLWSLGFAIAVFVIACPCGIGLAAPTAFVVGSGLAAKHGILSKGGEGFQLASKLDCIVFDKTGTLTEGADPKVLDELIITSTKEFDADAIYTAALTLEDSSTHPLARAIVSHCTEKNGYRAMLLDSIEVPGKGLEGLIDMQGMEYEARIGSERFMQESNVHGLEEHLELLRTWKMRGQSIVLFALRIKETGPKTLAPFVLAAAFATANPVRPEASEVIRQFQERGVSTWMVTGDNESTAAVVAGMVGLPAENVFAGVLPADKAEKLLELQQTFRRRPGPRFLGIFNRPSRRAVVAFVGDGINDAPALAVADVGIAIGSGSDIAISSASFVLVSSNLRSLLTLTELGTAVLNRVKLNFLWACLYNMIGLPIAAGILYPLPHHIRLDPVWASLAMALSSVSVVCSSLLLKTSWWVVGFRPTTKLS